MKNNLIDRDILFGGSTGCLALIDPDVKNDSILGSMITAINQHNFLAVLVGGSSITDHQFEMRVEKIKKKN